MKTFKGLVILIFISISMCNGEEHLLRHKRQSPLSMGMQFFNNLRQGVDRTLNRWFGFRGSSRQQVPRFQQAPPAPVEFQDAIPIEPHSNFAVFQEHEQFPQRQDNVISTTPEVNFFDDNEQSFTLTLPDIPNQNNDDFKPSNFFPTVETIVGKPTEESTFNEDVRHSVFSATNPPQHPTVHTQERFTTPKFEQSFFIDSSLHHNSGIASFNEVKSEIQNKPAFQNSFPREETLIREHRPLQITQEKIHEQQPPTPHKTTHANSFPREETLIREHRPVQIIQEEIREQHSPIPHKSVHTNSFPREEKPFRGHKPLQIIKEEISEQQLPINHLTPKAHENHAKKPTSHHRFNIGQNEHDAPIFKEKFKRENLNSIGFMQQAVQPTRDDFLEQINEFRGQNLDLKSISKIIPHITSRPTRQVERSHPTLSVDYTRQTTKKIVPTPKPIDIHNLPVFTVPATEHPLKQNAYRYKSKKPKKSLVKPTPKSISFDMKPSPSISKVTKSDKDTTKKPILTENNRKPFDSTRNSRHVPSVVNTGVKLKIDDTPEGQKQGYEFGYGVQDASSGNRFFHAEQKSGGKTRGSYKLQLPDGRIQTVSYVADDNGFHPQITYEGKAKYPTQKKENVN